MLSLYPKINSKIKVSTLWNNRCLLYYIVENYDRVEEPDEKNTGQFFSDEY